MNKYCDHFFQNFVGSNKFSFLQNDDEVGSGKGSDSEQITCEPWQYNCVPPSTVDRQQANSVLKEGINCHTIGSPPTKLETISALKTFQDYFDISTSFNACCPRTIYDSSVHFYRLNPILICGSLKIILNYQHRVHRTYDQKSI